MDRFDIDEVSVRMGFEGVLTEQAERYNTTYPHFSDFVYIAYADYGRDIDIYFLTHKNKGEKISFGSIGSVIVKNIEKHILSVPKGIENKFENKKLALALWAKANQFILYTCLVYMLEDGIIDRRERNEFIKKYRLNEFEKHKKKGIKKFVVLMLFAIILIPLVPVIYYYLIDGDWSFYRFPKKEVVSYEEVRRKTAIEFEKALKDADEWKKKGTITGESTDNLFTPPKNKPQNKKIKNPSKEKRQNTPQLVHNKDKKTNKVSSNKPPRNPYFGKHLYTGDEPYLNHFGYGVYDKELPSYLFVKNGSVTDAIVLLQSIQTGKIIRHVYIRCSQDYKIKNIPVGVYKMKVYYGNDWNPYKKHNGDFPDGGFMRNESFSAMSSSKDYINIEKKYESNGFTYSIYEITLHEVINGNMKTKEISKNDFFEK